MLIKVKVCLGQIFCKIRIFHMNSVRNTVARWFFSMMPSQLANLQWSLFAKTMILSSYLQLASHLQLSKKYILRFYDYTLRCSVTHRWCRSIEMLLLPSALKSIINATLIRATLTLPILVFLRVFRQ